MCFLFLKIIRKRCVPVCMKNVKNITLIWLVRSAHRSLTQYRSWTDSDLANMDIYRPCQWDSDGSFSFANSIKLSIDKWLSRDLGPSEDRARSALHSHLNAREKVSGAFAREDCRVRRVLFTQACATRRSHRIEMNRGMSERECSTLSGIARSEYLIAKGLTFKFQQNS